MTSAELASSLETAGTGGEADFSFGGADLGTGFSWGKLTSRDDDSFNCMTLLGLDALLGRVDDGGVETFDSVLETRREDAVAFVVAPMVYCV